MAARAASTRAPNTGAANRRKRGLDKAGNAKENDARLSDLAQSADPFELGGRVNIRKFPAVPTLNLSASWAVQYFFIRAAPRLSGHRRRGAHVGVVGGSAACVFGPDPEVDRPGGGAGAVPVVGGAGRVALHQLPGAGRGRAHPELIARVGVGAA